MYFSPSLHPRAFFHTVTLFHKCFQFRLKGSGLPHLIYLVESFGSKQRLGLPVETLQQAAVNTQVVDEFTVKYTKSHIDSMLYLSCMTKLLIRIFKVSLMKLARGLAPADEM